MNTKPTRKNSLRLSEYDYSESGSYFITVCTHKRQCALGKIIDNQMVLNEKGHIVNLEWKRSASLRSGLNLDEIIIMPNHIHGIIQIQNPALSRGATCCAREESSIYQSNQKHLNSNSLSTIIRSFKSAVTRKINLLFNTSGATFWQRSYYEHIIRNEAELERIREYIATNLFRWDTDKNNPKNF
ncbi:transposase [bacterium]|nr:transposase [bacterium]